MGKDSEKASEGGHSGEPYEEYCRGKLVGEVSGGDFEEELRREL